jgi:ADP-ribose pyrophosphatase YjhB (NUDIX family)
MPSSAAEAIRHVAIRLAGLSQDGLAYTTNPYDQDRFQQIGLLAAELLAILSRRPADELLLELGRDAGYATPKIDVRGVVFDDAERVLLMRERIDGRWSVPGGWADPGDAPSVAVTREVLEESGYPTTAVKLIACWDREQQANPPPMPIHIYKLFFLCQLDGPAQAPSARETLDVGWFSLDALPPLSLGRVNQQKLNRALRHQRDRLLFDRVRLARALSGANAPRSPDRVGGPSLAEELVPDEVSEQVDPVAGDQWLDLALLGP